MASKSISPEDAAEILRKENKAWATFWTTKLLPNLEENFVKFKVEEVLKFDSPQRKRNTDKFTIQICRKQDVAESPNFALVVESLRQNLNKQLPKVFKGIFVERVVVEVVVSRFVPYNPAYPPGERKK